ncbi:hypothetical protein T439DRAFT_324423 [Meredithblackwellia eburnea MCA 4105]
MSGGRSHQKGLASVGSASSLFGSSSEETDFFNSLSTAPPAASTAPAPPNAGRHVQPGPQAQQLHRTTSSFASSPTPQGISTVIEEDEPESPDLSRKNQQYFSNNDNGATSQDWYSNQHNTNDPYAQQQQPQEYQEPPYYPGFVYDPATNSYLPDPNEPQDDGWGTYDDGLGTAATAENAQQQQQPYQQDLNGGGGAATGIHQQWDQSQPYGGAQDTWGSYDQPNSGAGEYVGAGQGYDANQYAGQQGGNAPQTSDGQSSWDYGQEDPSASATFNTAVSTSFDQYASQNTFAQPTSYDSYQSQPSAYQQNQYNSYPDPTPAQAAPAPPPPPAQQAAAAPAPRAQVTSPPPQPEPAIAPPPRSSSAASVAPPPRSQTSSVNTTVPPPPRASAAATSAPASGGVVPPPRSASSASQRAAARRAAQVITQSTPPTASSARFEAPVPSQFESRPTQASVSSNGSNGGYGGYQPPSQQHHQSLAPEHTFDASGWDEAITTSPDPSHDNDAAQRAAAEAESPVSPRGASRPPWQQQQQQPSIHATQQQATPYSALSVGSSAPAHPSSAPSYNTPIVSAPPPPRAGGPPKTTPTVAPIKAPVTGPQALKSPPLPREAASRPQTQAPASIPGQAQIQATRSPPQPQAQTTRPTPPSQGVKSPTLSQGVKSPTLSQGVRSPPLGQAAKFAPPTQPSATSAPPPKTTAPPPRAAAAGPPPKAANPSPAPAPSSRPTEAKPAPSAGGPPPKATAAAPPRATGAPPRATAPQQPPTSGAPLATSGAPPATAPPRSNAANGPPPRSGAPTGPPPRSGAVAGPSASAASGPPPRATPASGPPPRTTAGPRPSAAGTRPPPVSTAQQPAQLVRSPPLQALRSPPLSSAHSSPPLIQSPPLSSVVKSPPLSSTRSPPTSRPASARIPSVSSVSSPPTAPVPKFSISVASPELPPASTFPSTVEEINPDKLAGPPREDDGASTDDDAWFGEGEEEGASPSPPAPQTQPQAPAPLTEPTAATEEVEASADKVESIEVAQPEVKEEIAEAAAQPEAKPEPLGQLDIQKDQLLGDDLVSPVDGEYGFDDSQVFGHGDGGMSASTSGSNYGEWTGESEAAQGYDYVSGYSAPQQRQPTIEIEPPSDHTVSQPGDPYAPTFNTSTSYSQYSSASSQAPENVYSQHAGAPSSTDSSYGVPSTSVTTQAPSYVPQRTDSPFGIQAPPPPRATSPYEPPPRRQPGTAETAFGPHAGAPPPPRSFTPEQRRGSMDQGQRQGPLPHGSPPKRSIAAYASSPKKTGAAQYAASSKTVPHRLETFNSPYGYDQQQQPPPVSAPPISDSYDSYATYPSYTSPVDGGNTTAPASFTNYPAAPFGGQQSYDNSSDPYATSYQPVIHRQGSVTSVTGNVANLGLDRSTAPVVRFGFGGRILLVFPNEPRQSFGLDTSPYGAPPTSSSAPSTPTTVHIRKIADLYPPSESTTFPGPIFLDGGKANAGKKRKEATIWLDQRISELQQEVSYFQSQNIPPGQPGYDENALSDDGEQQRKLETRLVLVKLVKALVENEGKLSGTPKIDDAVRSILAPFSTASDTSDAHLPLASELASAAQASYGSGTDAPFITYGVTSTNLDRITEFLLRGERRHAVKYALEQRMWAHAFVISSCVDTDCWKEVVAEFLRSELSPPVDGTGVTSNGREGLRVAYSMFAGLGADSATQFLPPRALAPPPAQLQHLGVGLPAIIPRSPTPIISEPNNINLSPDILVKWQETVALIIANRSAGDSAALTALGDTLKVNGWLDAAHVCYLLSPTTSLLGGVGSSARYSLVGGEVPTPAGSAGLDLESVMLTELVEFAYSLIPAVKGQEPFVGFPHLQALKLQHASHLADSGQVSQAQKYTDAIGNTIKLATKPSPFYNAGLVAQVKALSDRLTAAPGHDKGSWIARKVPRPTIDSLWTGLEGRFTKFVAGEGEPSAQEVAAKAEVAKQQQLNGGVVGPFSHYSSISPGSTSGTLSRTQSQSDLTITSRPPSRPTSAAASHTPAGPPPVKRAAFKTHHSRSSSLGFAGYNYDPNAPPPWQSYTTSSQGATPKSAESTPRFPTSPQDPPSSQPYGSSAYDAAAPSAYGNGEAEVKPQGGPDETNNSGWWGDTAQSGGGQAPTFLSAGDQFTEDDSGFISPMGFTPAVSPMPSTYQPPNQNQTHRRTTTREELDDLGLGNSKSRKSNFDAIDEQAGEAEDGNGTGNGSATPTAVEKKPESEPAQQPGIKPSKSWLGGWFKREPSPAPGGPGPVKANLGEETSLVYDPELKRWVNKKTGVGAVPLATAPPPRAATASPTASNRNPARFMSETPPPVPRAAGTLDPPPPSLNRSKTSADLNELHRTGQFRSASAQAGFAPSSSAGAGGVPPPPMGGSRPPSAGGNPTPPSASGTPNSAAGRRKPISKRYVAVS